MAIRLKVQEDKVTLKVGQGEGATLNAVREERPILVNDYDDLINKPSINGVELEGNLTTEDLHIQAGVTSWNGQTGDVVYTPPEVPVQSVNGETGDVILNAADVGALPDTTPIPVDADLVHKAGAETITGSKTFTNGVEISRPTSGAILKLSSAAADTNFILERTGGSQCVLESGSSVGLFGTKSNHPLQVRTNYVNRMTIGTDGSVELATAPAASSNNNQVATTKWVNDKGFVNAAQAASAAPVQSVNGQSGAVVLDADDVGALPDNTTYVGSVSVTPDLTSGTKVGSIDIDGTSTDLYAPTNTDTKVTQTATTTTDYTYWRGLCVGNSAVQSESGAFSTVTDGVRTFNNIRVQPSTGTIKATVFKGDLTGDVTGTASGNLKSGDNVSSLTNDANYITAAGAPVQSVNTATGDVVLGASDVGALADDTKYAASPAVGGSATFANGIHYGRVDDTSTATAFTVTIPGITSYYDGLTVILYNGKVTSASGYTININGLGAYGTYNNMTLGNEITPTAPTRDTTIFNINYAMIFTYCSDIGGQGITGWIGYRGYDANTNTLGYQIRTNSIVRKVTDRTRYYRMLFSSADDTKWVPANTQYDNSATSTKTVNQRPINPFGEIVYLGSSTNYAADANMSATTIWQQYTFTLGYSFNRTGAALTLTTQKPVYVKCAPQADGSAIMDSTEPIVQNLPTTADGKIYIWLGTAYSATNIELTIRHPVYYIDANGRKRIWTGENISI